MKCFIICHNNGWLVRDTVKALRKFQELEIIVVDNGSHGPRTLAVLKELATEGVTVHALDNNHGHTVVSDVIKPADKQYIVTDPDLELSGLPEDTIVRLLEISKTTGAFKAGLALRQEPEDFLEGIYFRGNTITTHENVFWKHRIEALHPLEAYYADIDTTFAVYTAGNTKQNVRLAGPYCVRHLPWHKSWVENAPPEELKEYLCHLDVARISTTSRLILQHLTRYRLAKVSKFGEEFQVTLSRDNKSFWLNEYPNWEPETLLAYDRFADRRRTLVDIGTWIGPTVLYGSRRFRRVIAVEADRGSVQELRRNLEVNEINNVELHQNAIYHESTTVHFGKNRFLNGSRENDSTCQIQQRGDSTYEVATITLKSLLSGVPAEEIALIKVDVEGGEETVMEDLLRFHLEHGTPLLIGLHVGWWSDPNRLETLRPLLERTRIKGAVDLIRASPFSTALFT